MQASFLEGRNTFARFFSAVVGFSFAVAGFCNKVSAPNFYLFVLKWPSRHSHNFGAHNHLLVLCTIKCAGVMCNAQCNAMQVNPWWRWQLCWAMHDLAIKAPLTNLALLRTMHSHTSTCLTFDKIKCILLIFLGQIYQVPKTLNRLVFFCFFCKKFCGGCQGCFYSELVKGHNGGRGLQFGQDYYSDKVQGIKGGEVSLGGGRVITAFPRNFLASPLPLAVELWPFWASFYYFKSPPGETQIFFQGRNLCKQLPG